MRTLRRFVLLAAVALLVVGVTTTASQAQVRVLPNSQAIVNPYYRVAPGLPLNQAAYNVRVMGRAYQSVPPWVYGYNPYPSPIYTYPTYPVYPTYPSYYPTYPSYPTYPNYLYGYPGYLP